VKNEITELKKQVKDLEDKPSKMIASNFFKYLGVAFALLLTMILSFMINNVFT
jgi:cell division protein FtsB